MSIEKHKAFLDSLEGEKGLPEEMHGWRFDEPLNELSHAQPGDAWRFRDYMIERCRRAESRQIPDLKERVKELVLDAMNAEDDYAKECLRTDPEASPHAKLKVCDAFRALCEPEKDSKEVAR